MRGFLVAALAASIVATAGASVANFDGMTEGTFGLSITDGGITFSNLDQYFGTGPHDNFTIEDASGDLTGQAGFTSPNTMGFGGWSPGPGAAFTRLGAFDFSNGASAQTAGFDIYSFANDPNMTITLQGLLNGNVVNSSVITVPSTFTIQHTRIDLPTGNYNGFHVVSAGPTNQGATFVLLDNVSVTPVPEPASMAVLGLGALLIRRRRKQK
jgi:hypothetical protein